MSSASLRPLEDMQRRLDGARQDSDVALFYDLLGYGELLTKLIAWPWSLPSRTTAAN